MKAFNILGIVVSVVIPLFSNADASWCTVSTCRNASQHTLCRYSVETIDNQRCGTVDSSTLSDDDVDEILSNHNSWRAYVGSGFETEGNPGPQPGSAKLGPMTWDEDLARVAQTWADQCTIGHDACRDTYQYRVGQNIGFLRSTDGYADSWRNVMLMWYDEVEQFNKAWVTSYPAYGAEATANYTQVVWQNTTLVGCGGIRFNPDGKSYNTYLVCNYAVAGNIPGQPVYIPY